MKVSIEFYSVHGGFPVSPEYCDPDAVVQNHKTGMAIETAAKTRALPAGVSELTSTLCFATFARDLERKVRKQK